MAAGETGELIMRAVLLSIKPEWWEKILAGEKDLEIRKTAPRAGAVAAAGPGLCERDRGGAGAVPLHGVGKKQLFSLFGLPLLCAR